MVHGISQSPQSDRAVGPSGRRTDRRSLKPHRGAHSLKLASGPDSLSHLTQPLSLLIHSRLTPRRQSARFFSRTSRIGAGSLRFHSWFCYHLFSLTSAEASSPLSQTKTDHLPLQGGFREGDMSLHAGKSRHGLVLICRAAGRAVQYTLLVRTMFGVVPALAQP